MQKVDPMVKAIAGVVDARFRTFEINIKRVIIDSEKRLSEKIERVEKKVDSISTKQDYRLQALEEHTGITSVFI